MTKRKIAACVLAIVAWFIGWTWNMPYEQYAEIAAVIVYLLGSLLVTVCGVYVVIGDD